MKIRCFVLLVCLTSSEVVTASWNNSVIHFGDFTTEYEGNSAERVLKGPLYQLGDYLKCINELKQQYCLADIQLLEGNGSSPFWQRIKNVTRQHAHFRRDILAVGVCVPPHSMYTDVRMHINETLSDTAMELGVNINVSLYQEACHTKENYPLDTADYIALVLVLSIVLLSMFGTFYDAAQRMKNTKEPKTTAWRRFLNCFSILANWQRLSSLNYPEDSKALGCIQGIRVISMYLIVSGHTMLFIVGGPVKNPEWLEQSYLDFPRTFFINGHIIMGTFFCISGFLLSYYLIGEMERRRKFGIFQFSMTIVYRYIRLTPAFAVMVALSSSLFRRMGSGPLWFKYVDREAEYCQQHWWINLLYLNNYFYVDKPCLLHTWYLAADFQNFVFMTFILVVLRKYSAHAKVIFSIGTLVWIIIPFTQTYVEKLDPTLLITPETVKNLALDKTFQKSYITFHHNAGAYFMGAIFGYMYYNVRITGVKHSKTGRALFWIIGLTVPWSLLLMGYFYYQPDYSYNVLIASFYAGFSKILFAAGIGTIITGCALGFGWICDTVTTWKPFLILGRLTYSVYLIHFCIQSLEAGASKEAALLSDYLMIHSMQADVVISYVLALVLCLLVEMPSSALLKLFYKLGAQQPQRREEEHKTISTVEDKQNESFQHKNLNTMLNGTYHVTHVGL